MMKDNNKLLIEEEEDRIYRVGSSDIEGRKINYSGSIGNEYFLNPRFHSKDFKSVHGGIN